MGKNQHYISPEREQELTQQILNLWAEGETNWAIGKKLGINWTTVEKFLKKAIAQANSELDVARIVSRWREATYRIALREVRQYYLGKASSRDANDAIEKSNKYNGVDRFLASIEPEKSVPLLSIQVEHVVVDMPPEIKEVEENNLEE
jgi:hypothetical protein